MSSEANPVDQFLRRLRQSGFSGDIETSYGARIVAATDNSIYQVLPEAIIYPAEAGDINRVVESLADFDADAISITARGGGTGTNGQSLNNSIILDTSRYLNRITEFDAANKRVSVEPGVVLDQLNASRKPHGLFFPAKVATASRATIGGLVATDASGKGSRIYGKTSAYIEQLDLVLSDGSDYAVRSIPVEDINAPEKQALGDRLQREVYAAVVEHADEIDRVFPDLNRGLTGYNLKQVTAQPGHFHMGYLLAGSEGTLALSKSISLRLLPLPRARALIVVLYDDYAKALRHVAELCESSPAAIEILDDKLIAQAQRDAVWQDIKTIFEGQSLDGQFKAMNFIEVVGDDQASIKRQCDKFEAHIDRSSDAYGVVTSLIETRPEAIAALWNLRGRAVGLLAALGGDTQGYAFVEDSTVPPAVLADYVEEFRAILDDHGIDYAMYGHADVGCLHVRPMLDMTQRSNRAMIRSISDRVAALVKRYGGLLWGEHGRGFRGEYSPLFFGEHLMPVLHQIKTAFDPLNRFNPGKLAVPKGSRLGVEKIDQPPFRGAFDEQIKPDWGAVYASAINCNGNASCFSWQLDDAMCPSYKATKDKRLSPKGRAAMLREWSRLQSVEADRNRLDALEDEIHASLNACLSCKSCSYSCPLKVDIPDLKSSFLQQYAVKNGRKLRDRLFARLEAYSALGRRAPGLANLLTRNPLSRALLAGLFGIIAPPRFSASLASGLKSRRAALLRLDSLPRRESPNENALILLPDSFNASFGTEVLLAAYDLLNRFGYRVLVAPVIDNGKALHVKGFREAFADSGRAHVATMKQLAETGLPLISVEVVTRLMHTKEYAELPDADADYRVWSIENWLAGQIETGRLDIKTSLSNRPTKDGREYLLLPHCMEQTADRQSAQDWQSIYRHLGLSLKPRSAGCCGMAGLFGHEKENRQLSEDIFRLNWSPIASGHAGEVLSSGFSCGCQLRRHGIENQHPLVSLSQML